MSETVRVADRPGMGRGVVASRPIAVGERVLTFHGAEVDRRGSHTLQVGKNAHLEVEPPGRFVNHSCDPSCGIRDRTTLVARRRIEKGEEITFDYAMTEEEMTPFRCGCGSVVCRGTVTGFLDLPAERHDSYRGLISDYLLS